MKSFSFRLMNCLWFSYFFAHLLFLTISFSLAESKYPESVESVRIKSTADGVIQNALLYNPKVNHPVPLLVALHILSSGWENTHNVPLAKGCIERGWAFIHPDFRGPNKRPRLVVLTLPFQMLLMLLIGLRKTLKLIRNAFIWQEFLEEAHMALQMAGRAPQIWAGVSSWFQLRLRSLAQRMC